MKTIRVLPLAVVAALAAVFSSPLLMAVPTEIARESFEGAGGAIGFTTSVAQFDEATQSATGDFFSVILNNGTKLSGGTITGGDGASMFAAEDIDTNPGPLVGATQSITFNAVNISGKTSTSVKILLAAPGTGPAGGGVQTFYDWSATAADIDFIRVEASVDGGPFNRLAQFSPTANTLSQPLSLDTDGDGLGGQGTALTAAFQDFDLPFPTGASVQIRVVMHTNATSEYICIDNVRIFGDSPVTAPPALGGVPGAALVFIEGSAATALAPAITVTDADSANLASATVTISAGLTSSEDVLAATPSGAILAGDIVYTAGTGTLTITRSAPKAAYETVLRSVTYRNTNVTAPNTATRNITFSASDGVNASNSPIRQVQVVDNITVQSLPFTESFETDGRGTRYALDGRFTNGAAMFDRGTPAGVTNLDGTFAIIAEDTLIDAAPVKAVAFLLNTAPFGTVSASVRLGALGGAIYDTGDIIAIEASVNGGAFTTVAAFRSTGGASTPIALDTNNDGIGDGTQLSTAMQDFSFPMPAATTLGLRVRCQSNTAGERLIVDRIVVTGNATPTVSAPITDVTANEDAVNGTVNLRSFFTDSEDLAAGLTYTVQTNTNAGLVATSINNSTDVLTLDYADNLSGTANITIRATDTGGLFVEDTFLVTVNAVNDVPSFTRGADQGVLEDSGLRTVVGWATALSAGPADEAGQALNFIVGNNNPSLFVLQPAIAANGTLTFTPAPNANGTATVTVQIHDNGGTANGGVDTSGPQSFLITVTAVNDVPGFTKGADQTVNEDAGTQGVGGWATAISAGPGNEAGQALNFIVNNNNNALFAVQPAVAANGLLTYTPAPNASGNAVVTLQIHDNGGVLNGGVDTSAPQNFLITVNAVNDAPSFTKGADQTVNEDAGPQTVPNWATALSAGPVNEAGQALNFIVGNNNPSLFSLQPTVSATGTLTYTPANNANGSATVTVQIHDNGGTANGGVDTSAAQTFTINVTAVNDAPSITAQVPIALAQGHSRTIVFTDLTVTDPDNTYPTGFTLTGQNGANYSRTGNTITPTPGFVGTLSVPVQVNDSAANSNVFNLIVTVNPNAGQVATNATIVPEPGGGFRVSFLGAPGATYTIQYTNSLAPVNWQPLGTAAAAANGRYSMLDIPPVNTQMRFYRSIEPYLNDFGNGLGKATLHGSAVLSNGAVKLTDEVTGGTGVVVFDGLAASPALTGFTARFNLALGPGTAPPADGASFAVGNLGAVAWGEMGPATPNSLAVGFDTFANGPANESIGIHIWVNGAHLAVNATNPYTNGATVPVEIIYDTVNGLTVRYNSALIFTNLALPGFTFPAAGGGFGIGARTGGSLERATVDDVEITPR